MFNKIKDSLRPFLPAGNPGVPPNPVPEAPPRPTGAGKVHPTIGPPPNPKNETPVVELELWIQSK